MVLSRHANSSESFVSANACSPTWVRSAVARFTWSSTTIVEPLIWICLRFWTSSGGPIRFPAPFGQGWPLWTLNGCIFNSINAFNSFLTFSLIFNYGFVVTIQFAGDMVTNAFTNCSSRVTTPARCTINCFEEFANLMAISVLLKDETTAVRTRGCVSAIAFLLAMCTG